MAAAKERGELSLLGSVTSYADVNERDKQVYFVREGETVSRNGDFLLGGCLGVVLALYWIPALIIGLIWAANTEDDSAPMWVAMRGPAIAACLLLLLMPLLGRRAGHAHRLARGLRNGELVAVPITARACALAEVAKTGRSGYFDYAQLLGKATAMRAQAAQLQELANDADPAITGADYRQRAATLALELTSSATQYDELIDEWMAEPTGKFDG